MDFVPVIPNPISKKEAEFKNSLVLAFVGDCVQELYVKTKLAITDEHKSGLLHQKAIGELSAKSQAVKSERLVELFTEEEMNIYRRAKNSKPKSMAKNADSLEYHKATGIEAVWGYLFLTGQTERLGILLEG